MGTGMINEQLGTNWTLRKEKDMCTYRLHNSRRLMTIRILANQALLIEFRRIPRRLFVKSLIVAEEICPLT